MPEKVVKVPERICTIGDFVITGDDSGRFKLENTNRTLPEFMAAETFNFPSFSATRSVGDLLSLAFHDGVGRGCIGFEIGDYFYAEVVDVQKDGERDRYCELYRRVSNGEKVSNVSIAKAESAGELIDALKRLVGKDGY